MCAVYTLAENKTAMKGKNLYEHRSSNIFKTWLLLTIFFAFVIGIGWFFSQIYGNSSILVIAVAISVSMSVISYWYSDKIVLRMAHAEPVGRDTHPELYRIVENLAITAGLPMPRPYIIHEQAPNAFATGRNYTHAVVAVTDGLLQRLDRSELEGVIAHELSHIGNRDMLVSTMVVVLVGFVSLTANFFMRSLFYRSMFGRGSRGGGGNTIVLVVGIIGAILLPIAALLIQMAVSRKREFLADASGALLTRYPDGLANALEKIASDPTPMRIANNTTAHLWLDDPFKGKKRASWWHKLFLTHPPTEERVAALRGMKA